MTRRPLLDGIPTPALYQPYKISVRNGLAAMQRPETTVAHNKMGKSLPEKKGESPLNRILPGPPSHLTANRGIVNITPKYLSDMVTSSDVLQYYR
jgi:hypothetical protein